MLSGLFGILKKITSEHKFMLNKSELIILLISILWIIDLSRGLSTDVKSFRKLNYPNGFGDPETVIKKSSDRSRTFHRLYRRVASTMVPIREREKTSLCTYEVVTDVNLQRIPDKIDRVFCRKDSCKCADQGDFRCTQLYAQMNVTFLTNDYKSNFEFELINVEYACVCSRAPGGSSVNLLEPVIV